MKAEDVLENGFIAHSQVKARLKRAIAGEEQVEPEAVRADNKCIVGEWIYGPGKKYASLQEYAVLRDIHKSFHEEAYQALMLNKQGKKADAQTHVESGPFEDCSKKIKTALFAMKKAVS